MKAYTLIAFLVVGFFFLFIGVEMLGWLFLILAMASLFYMIVKTKAESAWEEMKEAEGPYPEGKITEYTKNIAGLFADKITDTKEEKEYSAQRTVRRIPHGAEKAHGEFKKLFK